MLLWRYSSCRETQSAKYPEVGETNGIPFTRKGLERCTAKYDNNGGETNTEKKEGKSLKDFLGIHIIISGE